MTGTRRDRSFGGPLSALLRPVLTPGWREVVVERVGATVLVRSARHDDPLLRAFAAELPAGPLSVVVDEEAPQVAVSERLVALLAARAKRGLDEARVLAPEGLTGITASRWRRLAERTGVALLVPAGPVSIAGTTLFAAGGWVRWAPGEPGRSVGPRHPVPSWQEEESAVFPTVHGGLIAEQLPLGVLLRPPSAFPVLDWCSVPPDPHRLTVVAGVPGGPPARAADVAAHLAGLPPEVCAAARLVSGDGQDVVALGRAVAELLGTAVTVADGVPVERGGGLGFVLHDAAGRPTWEPYLGEIRCRAGERTAAPLRWRAPHPGLAAHAPGVFRVAEGWVLGVMRSGLWLRQAGRAAQPVPVGAPVDPAVVTVAVGDPGHPLADDVWDVLPGLLDRLDPAVLRRVRLSVLGVPSAAGREAACALARERGLGLRPGRRAEPVRARSAFGGA
ncbi:hypothetical protein ACIGNX_22335 [Actinosynnema sp. NPDC053489]|uniref:hypothetical protein n=1 Tax=Actinosynnema sp. NPDC053489 TaxID=3363916 RepID=UPI0037C94401